MSLSENDRVALLELATPLAADGLSPAAIADELNRKTLTGPVETAEVQAMLLATGVWGGIVFRSRRGPISEAEDGITKLCINVVSALTDRQTLQMQVPAYAGAVTTMLGELEAAGLISAPLAAGITAMADKKWSAAERAIGRTVSHQDISEAQDG